MVRFLAVCVLITSTASAQAFDFTFLFGERRSDFCSAVLDGRVSVRTTMMARQCEKASPADQECKAKCDEMVAILRTEEEQLRAAVRHKQELIDRRNALERAEANGTLKNYPGREITTAEQYCKTATVVSIDECEVAFNTGAKKADEALNKEQFAKDQLNARLRDPSFLRAMNAIRVGFHSDKIDSSLKSQSRQREIAAQSGYINRSEMHRLGSIVVDGKNTVRESFDSYRKSGGILDSPSALASTYKSCSERVSVPITFVSMALSGFFQSPPTDEEMQTFANFEKCIQPEPRPPVVM